LELNWSTFILEIVNFLVLVWILKRFLYRPVLDVMERRRKAVEDKLAEAGRLHDEAEALKQQYGGRLATWETEKREAAERLAHEIDAERARRLDELARTVEKEKEKSRVAGERQRAEQERAVEHRALELGAAFSGRLLAAASGPELEKRLTGLVLEGLAGLPEPEVTSLREQWGTPPESIEVASAFPIAGDDRARLETALRQVSGLSIPVRFSEDGTLLAGLRIVIGAWVLAANVRDELRGFAELARVPG